MKVGGKPSRSIWTEGDAVVVLDQTRLPFEVIHATLQTAEDARHAISHMQVRGAPLIGVTGAYGLALALRRHADDAALERAAAALVAARPTAVNLGWGVRRVLAAVRPLALGARAARAWQEACAMAEEDVILNRAIGEHGAAMLQRLAEGKGRPLNVLTHCNAGWLATVDWGTALAPIYVAQERGLPVHVWVSETRPRNQGLLTAWELGEQGVAHTVIADNAAGHLMQRGEIDVVIVGADRVSRHGDVCNKIGTYLKALAAQANGVPFYAAVPGPTIDWEVADAVRDIPIEARNGDELRRIRGLDGETALLPGHVPVANPAFDVTPGALVTGLITEHGVLSASQPALERIARP